MLEAANAELAMNGTVRAAVAITPTAHLRSLAPSNDLTCSPPLGPLFGRRLGLRATASRSGVDGPSPHSVRADIGLRTVRPLTGLMRRAVSRPPLVGILKATAMPETDRLGY